MKNTELDITGDVALLAVISKRENFMKANGGGFAALAQHTKAIVLLFREYFETVADTPTVDYGVIVSNARNKKIPDIDMIVTVLQKVQDTKPSPSVEKLILAGIQERKLATNIQRAIKTFDEGGELDLYQAVANHVRSYEVDRGMQNDFGVLGESISDVLDSFNDDSGIKWRLKGLNQRMRPLRSGDFGIFGARPDMGKTTWMAAESTYFASQLQPDDKIVIINNEGKSSNILLALYRAALGVDMTTLQKYKADGSIEDRYKKAINASKDNMKILVFDAHGAGTHNIDFILRKEKPKIVFYDMLDNINIKGGDRHLQLESLAQWARNNAIVHDHIGLATSQLSAEADNMLCVPYQLLTGSKTGKQGACDFIITMGCEGQPSTNYMRGFNIPKNKLMIGNNSLFKVTINPNIARFEEIVYNAE